MPNVNLDRVIRLEFSNDKSFETVTDIITNIVAGTLKIEEMLTDKDLKYGSLFASKLEVQIYDKDDLSNKFIRCIITENNVDKPMFFGIVDSCTKDYSDTYRDIVAYDMSYFYNKKNGAWAYNQFWEEKQAQGQTSCTLAQLRAYIITTFNIPFSFDPLPDDTFIVKYSVPISSISVTNLLQMLFAMSCKFLHFTRAGRMEVIHLDYWGVSEVLNLEGLYEKENSIFEEAPIAYYTNVQLYDALGTLKYDTDTTPPSANKTTNPYTISNNLLIQNAAQPDLKAYGDFVKQFADLLRFTPCDVQMIVGDLDIKVGQRCHTSQGDFFVFHNELSGPLLVNQKIGADANLQNNETSVETSFATAVLEQGTSGGGGTGGNLIDIMSNIVLCAGIVTVGAFQATFGSSFVVTNRNIRANDVVYNIDYVQNEDGVLSLITDYELEGQAVSIDKGNLAVVEFDNTNFQESIYMEVQ